MITQAILVSLIIWCCIVNSQATGVYFGIDWRADNLDNVLFWGSLSLLLLVTILGVAGYYGKQQDLQKSFMKSVLR